MIMASGGVAAQLPALQGRGGVWLQLVDSISNEGKASNDTSQVLRYALAGAEPNHVTYEHEAERRDECAQAQKEWVRADKPACHATGKIIQCHRHCQHPWVRLDRCEQAIATLA